MKIFPINPPHERLSPEAIKCVLENTTEEVIIYDRLYRRQRVAIGENTEIFLEEGETDLFISFLNELGLIKR